MKTRLIVITTLVLVLALPAALYAQETDPASVVKAASELLSAGDLEGCLALWADDGTFQLEGLPSGPETYKGKEQLRSEFKDEIANHIEIQVEVLKVEGDTVTTRTTTWHDFTRQIGVAPLEATEVYVIKNGQIASATWTISPESLTKVQAALATLPETGGVAFPTYALVMVLGSLAILSGLGLELLRRRLRQQG
jgi:ketosteroid isomerase-like protein